MESTSSRTRASATGAAGDATRNLTVATLGFALAFWGWALLSPLGSHLQDRLALSPQQVSLLVAVPVVVGSLGRIPVGALTDRFGARVMFPAVSLVSVLPVLYLGLFADSYTAYLVGGFFLGIAGTTFAIGVPHVSAWYPPHRRGLAVGIFGAGTGGTAISAFTTVQLVEVSEAFPFVLVAVLLAVFGVASALLLRPAPGRPAPPAGSMVARFWAAARLGVTLRASVMYALGFGGFVAFSVYLPTYLRNGFGVSQEGAALRTAGFVLLAVLMRPVGGWLSDRHGPLRVLAISFTVAGALAGAAALHLTVDLVRGAVFLTLAGALGAAAGASFAYVARYARPEQVGGVTGVVGACGGLGGFVPPLLMGAVYEATGGYAPGLWALAVAALLAAAWVAVMSRRSATSTASPGGAAA